MQRRHHHFFVLLLLVFAGCSSAPAPNQDYRQARPLEGVPSAWSVRLDSVGDVDLLGSDSAMKEALVATGDSIYVAATSFVVDGTYALDMIVVNHSDHELVLRREDIHLLDAEGRWLEPVDSAPHAAALGLQGRRYERAGGTPVYEVSDSVPKVDGDTMMVEPDSESSSRPRKLPPVERDHAVNRRDDAPAASAPASLTEELPVVRAVRIAPGEGRAFWAYFQGEAPPLPLTALVVVDEEQLGFKFGR